MKKSLVFVLLIASVLFLSAFASAFWPFDSFELKITGHEAKNAEETFSMVCQVDSSGKGKVAKVYAVSSLDGKRSVRNTVISVCGGDDDSADFVKFIPLDSSSSSIGGNGKKISYYDTLSEAYCLKGKGGTESRGWNRPSVSCGGGSECKQVVNVLYTSKMKKTEKKETAYCVKLNCFRDNHNSWIKDEDGVYLESLEDSCVYSDPTRIIRATCALDGDKNPQLFYQLSEQCPQGQTCQLKAGLINRATGIASYYSTCA